MFCRLEYQIAPTSRQIAMAAIPKRCKQKLALLLRGFPIKDSDTHFYLLELLVYRFSPSSIPAELRKLELPCLPRLNVL
jgi:hypothetical protein